MCAWVGMDKETVLVRMNDTDSIQLGLEEVIKLNSCFLGLCLSQTVLGLF